MKITLESFGSLSFDGVNCRAYLPDDMGIKQQPVKAIYVPRHLMPPIYGVSTFTEQIITILVELLTGDPDYVDTVKAEFDVYYDGEKKLLGHDTHGKQWYKMCKVVDQQHYKDSHLLFKLACGDAVWHSETLNSDTSWTVTATGQTHVISPAVAGKQNAYPVIRLTPNTAKSSGALPYRRLSKVYNQSDLSSGVYPFDITHGGWNSAAVIADTSKSNQINNGAGITAGATTIAIDTPVGGGLPSAGMGYVGTEQISWTANSGSSLTGVTRGINGTTAATHADNAVINLSRLQADGGDVRIYVDGAEVDYWFGTGANAINQAATKIWVNLRISPKIQLTLGQNLTGGVIASFTVGSSRAELSALATLPTPGKLLIGSEVFTYTGKNPNAHTITGVTRAIDGTAAASHTAGDAVRWLEHTIWLMYGNQELTAPTISDSLKPIFDLTSTNSAWTYSVFTDTSQVRPGSCAGSLIKTDAKPANLESRVYWGNHTADADPATEMGIMCGSWQNGRNWKADNIRAAWSIFHPFGVTDISSSGEKYRSSASWPAIASLQKSSNSGKQWTTVWNEAAGGLASWDTWTHNSVSLSGAYRFLRFYIQGAQAAGAGAYYAFEVNDLTLNLDTSAIPTGALDAEISNYELNAKITLVETGHYFIAQRNMALSQYYEVDADQAESTYGLDGTHGPRVLLDENRPHFIELQPGVTNTLQFDDPGTTSVDVDIYWRDRAS